MKSKRTSDGTMTFAEAALAYDPSLSAAVQRVRSAIRAKRPHGECRRDLTAVIEALERAKFYRLAIELRLLALTFDMKMPPPAKVEESA